MIATTLIKLVPNTRYRISCHLKRSAHGNIGAHFFSMGAKDKSREVHVYLGYKKDGLTGVWEKFEEEFTSADLDVPYEMVLSNWTKGAATVWFDDIRIEEVP
jgi:DNA relaxase NicK